MAPVKTNIVRLAEQADAASVANENAASGAELSFRAGEDHFERLTALAADIFDMPIAGIAVAEGGGLCFKGAVGVDATVLPPLSDLIARVLRNDEIVLSAPGGEAGATADLGFFVGLPLHDSAGRPLGAVALADRGNRPFGERQRQRLERLAAIAEQELCRPAAQPATAANAEESIHQGLGELSGLAHFRSQLRAAAGRSDRDGGLAAVLLVGLDRFELMYNVVGRDDSDDAYQLVTERLLAGSGPDTTITRLGVDQFVVLIPAARDLNQVIGAAQRILAAFARPLEAEGRETHLTASIGISVYPFDGADAETLLRQSSAALFRSQREGGERYHFCTPDMKRAADERFELELALRKAVERGELELVYQPKVTLKDRRIAGIEALARWSHEGLGSVPPEKFIALAEQAHSIGPIGDWALGTACRQAKAWLDSGLDVGCIGVNVSSHQLHDPGFADKVEKIIDESGLAGRHLNLEITESSLIRDVGSVIAAMEQLAVRGVSFSIDDFGTGYSSLSYLTRLPIKAVKIDRSFIAKMTSEQSDAAVVEAVIAMAGKLGLTVVAEGVETPQQLARLKQFNCDEAQGFLYSEPLPAAHMEALLRRIAEARSAKQAS
ncbi:MAG: bifunctional diguanylate cyclase/phosphodiesterase [Alphaproteobacteria bacterium]|nr:bifunctional diguanylate cyclase/phosphodiesterase [Alphaproteobacteria bacterium]